MSSDTFTVKVYTPAGLVFQDTTAAVTLPAADGEIGVLTMHTRYVGVLGTGILEYTPSGQGAPRRAVVSGGFCTFQDNELVILADSVDLPGQADLSKSGANRAALEKSLDTLSAYDPQWDMTQQKIKRIEAQEQLH